MGGWVTLELVGWFEYDAKYSDALDWLWDDTICVYGT